ncbi:uncharacterized protein G2W53_045131 [Senna tora]|uniref:Uncharacterized protein n=1 Tax=Senna tora TaxID=362788 RepID=A0A834VWT1_9FABA|nr:uncharacterized protein G2W53_045131 [Senna tora]
MRLRVQVDSSFSTSPILASVRVSHGSAPEPSRTMPWFHGSPEELDFW